VRGIVLTTIEFAFVCRGVCFEFLQHLISFAHQKTIEIFFIIQLYSSRGSKRILLAGEEGKTRVCTSNLYSAAVPEPKIEAKSPKSESEFDSEYPLSTSSSPRLVYQLGTHSIRFASILVFGISRNAFSFTKVEIPAPLATPLAALICLWHRDSINISLFIFWGPPVKVLEVLRWHPKELCPNGVWHIFSARAPGSHNLKYLNASGHN